jgi:hypothetical protein
MLYNTFFDNRSSKCISIFTTFLRKQSSLSLYNHELRYIPKLYLGVNQGVIDFL